MSKNEQNGAKNSKKEKKGAKEAINIQYYLVLEKARQ